MPRSGHPSRRPSEGAMMLAEMKEFAVFSAATQRYIRQSLDVGLEREEAVIRWSRDAVEAADIYAQIQAYERLPEIRALIPTTTNDTNILEPFMAPLVMVSAFDLREGRLRSFSSYRFLYERLLGAEVRPWLPSSFCSAAAMPTLHPDIRRQLLQSIPEAAAAVSGWSIRQPVFFPAWVEKVEGPEPPQAGGGPSPRTINYGPGGTR